MKKILDLNVLPLLVLLCGAVGLGLHKLLYLVAVDVLGLLTAGHPVEVALWLLSAAVAAVILAAARRLDPEGAGAPRSPFAAQGHFVFGICVVLTVLFWEPAMGGSMGQTWKWLGLLGFLVLMWAGFSRMEGNVPSFGAHLGTCVFVAFHVVTHYRAWSGDPQLLDYVFTLLGTIALLCFAYYQTALDVGFCKRRQLVISGLLAMYFGMVGLIDTPYWLLHLGGIVWVWSNLFAQGAPKEGVKE